MVTAVLGSCHPVTDRFEDLGAPQLRNKQTKHVTARNRVGPDVAPRPGSPIDDAESWSSRSARLTVGREAPNTFTSSDSLGSRWPAWYSPEEMASVRVCRIRSCFDTSDLVATLLIIQ